MRKRDIIKKWNGIIDSQRYYFSLLKKSGQIPRGQKWTDSGVYKGLVKKKAQAIYRHKNRKRIAAQRAQYRERKRQAAEGLGKQVLKQTFSGSAIDAFKGRRSRADLNFALSINAKNFVGHLEVYLNDREIVNKVFLSVKKYFAEVGRWIHSMFSKDDYTIFNSEVIKKLKYDPQTQTLYIETVILINTEDE